MHIVIIGAGVLGASAAWHAAGLGAAVTIVDAALEGRATAAGAGIICPWVSGLADGPFFRLYVAGGEYYPDFAQALAQQGERDLGYRRAGAMLVAAARDELAATEQFARRRARAFPAMGGVELQSPVQAQALFPPLSRDLGGILIGNGARVDGRRLNAALLRAAGRLGCRIVQAQAEPWVETGCARGALVDGERIAADCVIVTTGAWMRGLPVRPQRGQIVHLSLPHAATEHWPVILPPGSHYLVPFDSGRIVAGATRESDAGFDYRVTAGGQAEVLSEALRIAPGLADATLIETRVGFRPVLSRPVLGWSPEVEGLAIGNGLGAAGLTIGPFAGRLLAELVMGHSSDLDLAAYQPDDEGADQPPAPLR